MYGDLKHMPEKSNIVKTQQELQEIGKNRNKKIFKCLLLDPWETVYFHVDIFQTEVG